MAYIKFCVIAVETSLKDQSVFVTFNKEVNSDTLNYQNIIVALNGQVTSPLASYDIILGKDLKTLQLKFVNGIMVNQPYIVILQDKISDLGGSTLDKSLFRNVIFNSSVTSTVRLDSPANFEVVQEQKFSWTELGDNPVNSFRVQVSTDTGFHNLETDIVVKDQTSVAVGTQLKTGQYFFRVRAEQDNESYGVWSDIRSFLLQPDNSPDSSVVDITQSNDTEEVIVEDFVRDIRDDSLKIEQIPINGVTPDSFSFLFSDNIDATDITISVIRSDF